MKPKNNVRTQVRQKHNALISKAIWSISKMQFDNRCQNALISKAMWPISKMKFDNRCQLDFERKSLNAHC